VHNKAKVFIFLSIHKINFLAH